MKSIPPQHSGCPFPYASAAPASGDTSYEADVYLDTVLASIADGIISIDERGIIQRANTAALNMFGYRAEEVLGQNISMLMPEPYRSRHDSILARNSGTTRPDLFGPVLDLKGERKDGSIFHIGMVISILPAEFRSRYISVIRDITQQKRLEHLRQSLISVMSHELRTPLTAIIGALSLLKMPEIVILPSNATDFVDMALRHSIRLQRLTQQLLDAEQLSNSAIDIPLASHELQPILQQVLDELQPAANVKCIRLPSASRAAGHWVWADNFRLKRVISTLIDNAIRYSRPDSCIELNAEAISANRLRINIADNGPGLSQDLQESVFQQFSSTHHDASASRAGLGLSLPIASGFMQQMQGNIGIRESSPTGSTFYIDLLLATSTPR
ncbi:MAG: PAS domain S-box protein [Pseudomonadota bacterium]